MALVTVMGIPEDSSSELAPLGLTYDDVLLLPGETDVVPVRGRHHRPG